MPLLLVRQWQGLGRAPVAIKSPCRSITFCARRAIPSGDHELRPKPLFGGIIIPASLETPLPSLVGYINPIKRRDTFAHTFCVFFVTPAYASQLLSENDFLGLAIRRAYSAVLSKPGLVIDALCAVVDKLPVSRTLGNDGVLLRHVAEQRSIEPPAAGTGFEGMAYAILTPDQSLPSEHLPSSDNGAIDFITAQHFSTHSVYRDTLRLPLANTIFQTGTPTTMFRSKWETVARGRQHHVQLISKTNVSHHGLRLSSRVSCSELVTAFSIPLVPLTMPRVVEGCMGNIIRRVVDSEGQSVQASSELEGAVPRFFRSRGQPAQATVAWALVIPGLLRDTIASRTDHLLAALPTEDDSDNMRQEDMWERLWRRDPPMWNNLVPEALAKGARLHRVLSGGGGWGKKAGLLSLDPVPANQATGSSGDALLEMVNDPKDFESTLTAVVRAGDSIQFFVSPKSDLVQGASQLDSIKKLRSIPKDKADRPWGWEIGTVPSTMDSIPGDSWQHRPLQEDAYPTVFRGSFGALTEGALTLTQHDTACDQNESRMVNTTMVDVPFSRFWAVGQPKSSDDSKIKIKKGPKTLVKKMKSIHKPSRPNSFTHGSPSRTSCFVHNQPSPRQRMPLTSPTNISFGLSRQFSITALQQASTLVNRKLDNWISQLPRPLTVKQLGLALQLKGNQISTRLGLRAAKAIARELERRSLELKKQYEAIMPAIEARLDLKRKIEERKIQGHKIRIEIELRRKMEEQAKRKPGKSGIYLQPRVKRLVSNYVNIKFQLSLLSKDFDTIITASRRAKRRIRKYPVGPQSSAEKRSASTKYKSQLVVRKTTPDHVPVSIGMETYYRYHTAQITNLTVSTMNITNAIRNRVPNSSFRRVALSGPGPSPLQNWRDGYHELTRRQLRRWSAEHIRFSNDIIFIKYLVRRRKQVLLGDGAVPVNRYYAKPETARKPRVRNNTVGIRRLRGRVRVRRYTAEGSRTRFATRFVKQQAPPILRIRRYRGNPLRDSPLRKSIVGKQWYSRSREDDRATQSAERRRKKREFTSTVGAWLGGQSGGGKGLLTATMDKSKRVFGAGMRVEGEAANTVGGAQSATSGEEKIPMGGPALLIQAGERMEEKSLKEGGGRRRRRP